MLWRQWRQRQPWLVRVEVACVGGSRHGSSDDGGGHRWRRWRQMPPTAAAAAFRVEKWRFHGRFAAARGGAHDIAVHGGFGCFGGGF